MSKQKFVVYKRLSKKKATDNQHGFESQQIDIDIFLESEPGEVIAEFKEFVSGTADIKPELEKAFELCKQTGATLLVSKVDRLSRRVVQIASYLEGDVNFRIASMPSANNLTIGIFAVMAQEERDMIAKRVKRGLAAAKDKGVLLGAQSPVYQANRAAGLHKKRSDTGKRRECSLRKAETFRSAVTSVIQSHTMATKSTPSLRQVAATLNRMSTPTPSGKTGAQWSAATVSRVLKNLDIKLKSNS